MKKYLGVFIAIGFFILQSILIFGAGMSWDEPQNFFNGKKTLRFFLTGDRRLVDTWGDKELFAGDHMAYLYADVHYPPGSNIVGAVVSTVFSDRLHLVNWIDGFHIGEVAIGAVGIGFFYYLGILLGLTWPVAAVTTMVLGLYPTIFGQMRADAKNVPQMSAVIIFVYLFLRFKKSVHVWWGMAAVVVLSMISWPYLWSDPIGKLTAAWEFFRTIGIGNRVLYLGEFYGAGMNLPWHYPWVIFAVQTPVELIALAIAGIFARKDRRVFFIFLWFVLGLLRFMIPGMVIYAKIRHFIYVIPAFFLLVGFGLEWVRNRFSKRIFWGLGAAILTHLAWISYTFYPYEPSYFNFLVGGAKQVSQRQLFDVEHWATGTREAMMFINRQPGQQYVYGCRLNHLAKLYRGPHVTVEAEPRVGGHVLIPNMPSEFSYALSFYGQFGKPVHTVRRAGADLFYVYRVTDPNTIICGGEVATP